MAVALVTGSRARLGAHIAARLAEAGFDVALHASTECDVEPWLYDRIERAGRTAHCVVADLATDSGAAGLIAQVADTFGNAPTLLVNNASLFDPDESGAPDMAMLTRYLRVNAVAPTILAHALADSVGEGAVVNILDQRIRNPHPEQRAYTLSKMALGEATRLLARALAPAIRVNAVAPGLTMATEDYSEQQVDRLAAMMPLESLPSADDIADAVLYLAAARSVTGQTLFVDAGASLTAFDGDFVNMAR